MAVQLWRAVWQAFTFAVVSLLIIALSPVVLVAGELVGRRYLRPRMRSRGVKLAAGPGWAVWSAPAARSQLRASLAMRVMSNPLWIALTAPGRWVIDRVRPRAGQGRRGGGNGPPPAGVREPRRPRPDQPAGAEALPEPH